MVRRLNKKRQMAEGIWLNVGWDFKKNRVIVWPEDVRAHRNDQYPRTAWAMLKYVLRNMVEVRGEADV